MPSVRNRFSCLQVRAWHCRHADVDRPGLDRRLYSRPLPCKCFWVAQLRLQSRLLWLDELGQRSVEWILLGHSLPWQREWAALPLQCGLQWNSFSDSDQLHWLLLSCCLSCLRFEWPLVRVRLVYQRDFDLELFHNKVGWRLCWGQACAQLGSR